MLRRNKSFYIYENVRTFNHMNYILTVDDYYKDLV